MLGTKKYDLICSLGGNCSVAHNLEYKGLRYYSLPFDWCYIKNDKPIDYLCVGFKDNFKNFLLKENLAPLVGDEYNNSHTTRAQYKDIYTGYYFVNHFTKNANFDEDYKNVYEKMRRRLERLQDKIELGENILFILAASISVDIAKIIELKNVLNQKYPNKSFDFYILLFKQKEDKIVNIDSITIKYLKRCENDSDYNTTNSDWNFLDGIVLNKHNSLVSVLIPAYNHEKYVQETIKSIINQTYQNIELIIIDDGSRDSTWQKIQEMKSQCEKRFINVYFETKQNEGTCETLNKLLKHAKGEYVYIIASDDVAKPNAIEKELDFLVNNPKYALAVGDSEFVDSDGKRCYWDKECNVSYFKTKNNFSTHGKYLQKVTKTNLNSSNFGSYKKLYLGNHVPNGYLIRKNIFDKTGNFTKEAPLEDFYLMLQISKYAKLKFINEILFSYRCHQTNTVKNKSKMVEMTIKTREYEEKILDNINENEVSKEVLEVKRNGVCYKKLGIPFVIEFLTFKKGNSKVKILKLFGLKIAQYTKN